MSHALGRGPPSPRRRACLALRRTVENVADSSVDSGGRRKPRVLKIGERSGGGLVRAVQPSSLYSGGPSPFLAWGLSLARPDSPVAWVLAVRRGRQRLLGRSRPEQVKNPRCGVGVGADLREQAFHRGPELCKESLGVLDSARADNGPPQVVCQLPGVELGFGNVVEPPIRSVANIGVPT